MQAFINWVSQWFTSYFLKFVEMCKGMFQEQWDYAIAFLNDYVFASVVIAMNSVYPSLGDSIAAFAPYLGFLNYVIPLQEITAALSIYVTLYISFQPVKALYNAMPFT